VTEKLYYADSSVLDFDAAVIRCSPAPGSAGGAVDGAWEAVLDRTCFYPGGGGQPSDRGTLGGAPVVDVRELDDGEIVHVLGAQVPVGSVRGQVDAARRRDFMAQHTGQHIFSQALVRAGALETVSVHFGDDDTTIELKAESVQDSVLRAAEEIANAVIRENRPLLLHEIDRGEVSRFPLRRTPPDEGRLRIVEVQSYDWAACGGVHVKSAGEVFLVKAVSQEKIRGRVRVHVMIGARAFQDYGRKAALSQGLSRALTCGEEAILSRVQDMLAAQQEAARELRQLRAAAAGVEAEKAVAGGRAMGNALLVRGIFDAAGPDYLKAFVERAAASPGRVVLAVDKGPQSFQWIVAHSLDTALELSTIVARHFGLADAKGGGRGSRMQGVGARASGLDAFLQAIEKDLAQALGREGA
jgi:alanyl-tRNA synthetase